MTSSKAWCACCSSRSRTTATPPHAVFNIGNHQPVQVMEFIRTLEYVLGVEAAIEFLPMQPGDVPATHADTPS